MIVDPEFVKVKPEGRQRLQFEAHQSVFVDNLTVENDLDWL